MYLPKKWEKMRKIWSLKKKWKKIVSVLEKKIGSNTDTEIGPWFRFPIPKPGFGCTLYQKERTKSHPLIVVTLSQWGGIIFVCSYTNSLVNYILSLNLSKISGTCFHLSKITIPLRFWKFDLGNISLRFLKIVFVSL